MVARSFSQWAVYNQCPRKFKHRYTDKIATDYVTSPAAARGTEIHNSIEKLIKGEAETLHPEIEDMYGDFFRDLRDKYECHPEQRFAINTNWEECHWKDEDCLVRGFMDLVVDVAEDDCTVYEFKTGKEWDDHKFQKLLYGMVTLILKPKIKDVTVVGVYLDEGRNAAVTYRREMLGTYKWTWDRRFDMLLKDKVCAPNPSFLCKWCDFNKDKGGQCQF